MKILSWGIGKWASRDALVLATKQIRSLRAEVERLEQLAGDRGDRLDEYESARTQVLAAACAPGERHCTCVPELRAELGMQYEEIGDAWSALRAVLGPCLPPRLGDKLPGFIRRTVTK